MSITAKHKAALKNKKTFAVVDTKVDNYEKHPFFVKKANAIKALLKEVGLPKPLAKAR